MTRPSPEAEPDPPARPTWRRRLRWPLRAILLLVGLVAGYLAASEIGTRLSVNSGADPLDGDVDVYLVSNGVHVDVWVPTRRPDRDWREWFGEGLDVRSAPFVSFGWGDRGFYLSTPDWSDLTAGTAARAILMPSATVVRASPRWTRPREGDHVHLLRVSEEAYGDLVAYLDGSFDLGADGRPRTIDHPGYTDDDRFFKASGSYHMFRTCNVWTNGAVGAMGKQAALWAPFERNARFHLPRNRGRAGG